MQSIRAQCDHTMNRFRTINVVAAIITDGGKVLATQRGYGEWKGWWEFPGGKIEPGETPHDAIMREIKEELAVGIEVEKKLTTVEYDYPAFHLSMQCYLCHIVSGRLSLLEHDDLRWLSTDDIGSVRWLPADREVIPLIVREIPHR